MTDVKDNAKIMNEEPFGPLLPIDSFKSVDESIDRANRLDFGLASYAFTNDPKIIDNLRSDIQAGLLAVNSTVVIHQKLHWYQTQWLWFRRRH